MIFSVLAALAVATIGPALADCPNRNPLFYDSFSASSVSTRWLVDGTAKANSGGTFGLQPAAAHRETAITRSTFGDVSVCISVGIASGPDAAGTSTGVIFWATDANNFYVFDVQPRGTAQVFRVVRSIFSTVSELKPPSLSTGFGVWNDLRVDTVGNQATLFVNGVQAGAIDGAPPPSGQRIGFYAESAPAGPATSLAREVIVGNVPAPPPPVVSTNGPKPRGKDGLTDDQRGIFQQLGKAPLADDSGALTFAAPKVTSGGSQLPQVAFDYKSKDGLTAGTVNYAFATLDSVTIYFANGKDSPFVKDDAVKKLGASAAFGEIRSPASGIRFYWVRNTSPDGKGEGMWIGTAYDDVLIMVTLTRPRADLRPSDAGRPEAVSQGTIDTALKIADLAYAAASIAALDSAFDSLLNSLGIGGK